METNSVDVLALQELKLDQNKFPISDLEHAGYHAAWFGQKTYNGMALLFKGETSDVLRGMTDYDGEPKRMIIATCTGILFINVYCSNEEAIDSPKVLCV